MTNRECSAGSVASARELSHHEGWRNVDGSTDLSPSFMRLAREIDSVASNLDGDWPHLGSIPVTKCEDEINNCPGKPKHWDQSGYKPSTTRGKQQARLQLAEEIRQQIFSSVSAKELEDLDEACHHLESSMGRMSQVQWGCAAYEQNRSRGMSGRWKTTRS
jgi:hypothetical protein